jgi:hypothetical protein
MLHATLNAFDQVVLPLATGLRGDPDVVVFWLTTTLCALFGLLVPGGLPAL